MQGTRYLLIATLVFLRSSSFGDGELEQPHAYAEGFCDGLCSLFDDCCPTPATQCTLPGSLHSDSITGLYQCECMESISERISMINRCPGNNVAKFVKNACEAPSKKDGSIWLPPVSIGTCGLVFKNVFCAICHNVWNSSEENVFPWLTGLQCSPQAYNRIKGFELSEDYLKKLDLEAAGCLLRYYPNGNSRRGCLPHKDTCDDGKRCSGPTKYVSVEGRVYRNKQCAICNRKSENRIQTLVVEDCDGEFGGREDNIIVLLESAVSSAPACSPNAVYFNGKCSELFCPDGSEMSEENECFSKSTDPPNTDIGLTEETTEASNAYKSRTPAHAEGFCDGLCSLFDDCCPTPATQCTLPGSLHGDSITGHHQCECMESISERISMINRCPENNVAKFVKNACEAPSKKDGSIWLPPVSIGTCGLVFKNVFCAICHNVWDPSEENMFPWLTGLLCSPQAYNRIKGFEFSEDYLKKLDLEAAGCLLRYYPNGYSRRRGCFPHKDTCDDGKRCSGPTKYVSVEGRVYRNKQCAICNRKSENRIQKKIEVEDCDGEFGGREDNIIVLLESAVSSAPACSPNAVKFNGKCSKLFCPDGSEMSEENECFSKSADPPSTDIGLTGETPEALNAYKNQTLAYAEGFCDGLCSLFDDCCPTPATQCTLPGSLHSDSITGLHQCEYMESISERISVINRCPENNVVTFVKNTCEAPSKKDGSIWLPPVSIGTCGLVFKNVFCAICHNVWEPSEKHVFPWLTGLQCSPEASDKIKGFELSEDNLKKLDLEAAGCSITYYPNDNSTFRVCFPHKDTCDDGKRCSGPTKYVSVEGRAYRNTQCALCNRESKNRIQRPMTEELRGGEDSIKVLLNARGSIAPACSPNVYSKCSELFCSEGLKMSEKQDCAPDVHYDSFYPPRTDMGPTGETPEALNAYKNQPPAHAEGFCDGLCSLFDDCCPTPATQCTLPGSLHSDSISGLHQCECMESISERISIINRCPENNVTKFVKNACEAPSKEDGSIWLPPVLIGTCGLVFKNAFCAICHNVWDPSKENDFPWLTGLQCSPQAYERIKGTELSEDYLKKLDLEAAGCSLTYYPNDNSTFRLCFPHKDTCDDGKRCSGPTKYVSVEGRVYRNKQCAICNQESENRIQTLVVDHNDCQSTGLLSMSVESVEALMSVHGIPFKLELLRDDKIGASEEDERQQNILSCVQMALDISDVKMLPNGSIYVDIIDRILKENEYTKLTNQSLAVCYDPFKTTGLYFDLRYSVRDYLSLAGQILSLLSLLIMCGVYIAIKELRNLPGKCLLSLAIALFLAQVFFVVMTLPEEKTWPCWLVATSVHYFYLAAFFWMSVMSFDIWGTFQFKTLVPSDHATNKRFIYYSTYAWLTPLVIVVLAVLFDHDILHLALRFRPRYAEIRCWLNSKWGLLSFFVIPTASILLMNILMFLMTVINICRASAATMMLSKSQRMSKKRQLIICIKLSVVMGLTWVFGYLATSFENSAVGVILWYLFVIFNSLQGFLICIAFICNRRVLRMIRQRISTASTGTGRTTK